MIEWTVLAAGVGAGVFRSLGGWIENALEDGQITWPEVRQLGSTIVRVSVQGVAIGLGASSLGLDAEALAAGGALLMDHLLLKLKVKSDEVIVLEDLPKKKSKKK